MSKYLLGIDLGTSACKAALFDENGRVIAHAGAPYNVYYPHPGWAEQDPNEWWQGVCEAIRSLLEKAPVEPKDIAGIGIDGQSWSAVAIDETGTVLTNTPIWMDTRAKDICDRLNAAVGADRIYAVAGNSLQPSYTTPKVVWYRENLPEVYKKIHKILQSNGFIVYRLTGALTQDMSQGYGWHCFDMRRGCWDPDMAEALGIPMEFLPPIVACDHIAGTVTEQASRETGLPVGIPVVAGGLDAACGTLGVGVLHDGETQEQGGQAGGMSICTQTYSADPRLILSYHVVSGKWLLQGGTVGGGGVMNWFEKEFGAYERSQAAETGMNSFEQLNVIAADIPAGTDGLVFLPYMSGERSPIWDPDAKGVFYGLDFSKTKGHMVHACMEGTAFALRHNLEAAEEAGAKVGVLRAMGGAANSLLWTQIKSDVTGKPIVVPGSDEATALGAAMLAGVSTGVFASYEEAVDRCIAVKRTHEPNKANSAVYDETYGTYRELYESLKGLMKKNGGH